MLPMIFFSYLQFQIIDIKMHFVLKIFTLKIYLKSVSQKSDEIFAIR